MEMVIVSVTYTSEALKKTYDMEIPCRIPVNILLRHIQDTMIGYTGDSICFVDDSARLYCKRLSRVLDLNETFDDAGIWNGDEFEIISDWERG